MYIFMKAFFKSSCLIFIFCYLSLFSCKGPEGPQGPVGGAGPSGTAGIAGPKGADGTANVVYTEWKTPNWSNLYRYPDNTAVQFSLSAEDSKMPVLTKEVIDKADVHIYTKVQLQEWDPTNAEYKLVNRIYSSSSFVGASVKVPGRTTGKPEDFLQVNGSFNPIGENYFAAFVNLNTSTYDNAQQKYIPIPDLVGKAAAVYKEILKDGPQYRMVIIPGAVKAGRMASVDFSNYAAVKEVFGLKD
jgi:hypothetical protein